MKELFDDKNAAIKAEAALEKLSVGGDIRTFLNEFDMLAS